MSDATNRPDDNLDYLIDQYVSGRITEPEAAQLHDRLRQNPTIGAGLIDQLGIDALLRDEAKAELSEPYPISKIEPSTQKTRSWWAGRVWPGAVAACIGMIALLGWHNWLGRQGLNQRGTTIVQRPTTVESTPAEEAMTSAVAVLARAVDATWADGSRTYAAGGPLDRGTLRLKSGLVEIEFFSGARVVLEGPGELQLISPLEATCPAGRLSAEVPPPARGFRINTPRGAVIDLGTAFGLDVTAGGPQVHVFKGEVEFHPTDRPMQGLKQGQAASVDGEGRVHLFTADATAFENVTNLDRRAAEAIAKRFEAWQNSAYRQNADSDLLARFDFEEVDRDDHILQNRSFSSEPGTGGAIVGCGRAEGRWPGKSAIEFRGVSDRVRFEIPDELRAITFVASVRVNGLDRRFNSILMSDAFNAGATHWQILNDGRVRLGVSTGVKGLQGDCDSPVVFTPDRFGQWVHLAVTYDPVTSQVTHYVDGRPVRRIGVTPVTLKIGSAEVGNWNAWPRRDSSPIRHFSGRMDEVAVYRRALSDAEIAELAKN